MTIETAVGRVERQSPQTVSAYRERLEKKMREVLASTTMDEGRILTEAAIFADKVAASITTPQRDVTVSAENDKDKEIARLRARLAELEAGE